MASPQTEDGHVRIANELYEALTLANLSKNQYKVALAVMRRTYGWRKKADAISNSQFAMMTDMQGTHAAMAVRELIAANLLTCYGKTGVGQVLGINKNYAEWTGVWKSGNAMQRVTKSVTPKSPSEQGEASDSDDEGVTKSVTLTESIAIANSRGDGFRHGGVTKSVSRGDEICQGGVTKSVNTKDTVKNRERQIKNNTPFPPTETEIVATENIEAPQAASEGDAIQDDLFSAEQKPGHAMTVNHAAQSVTVNADPHDWKQMSRAQKTAAVEEVYEFWRKCMKSPCSKLDDKRIRAIEKALNDGWTLRDVYKAIKGCSLDPYHMGHNERQKPFNDVELILRDARHIEDFMAVADKPPKMAQPKSKAQVRGEQLDAAAAEFAANMKKKYGLTGDVPEAGYVPPNDGMTINME